MFCDGFSFHLDKFEFMLKSYNIHYLFSVFLSASKGKMADVPYYVRSCLQSGKLALLAILVSGGIVLQILVAFLTKHLKAYGH